VAAADVPASFLRRAERADRLAPGAPAVEEPLRFAAGLHRAQAEVARALAIGPIATRLEDALTALLGVAPAIWRFAARHGPAPLAALAQERLDEGSEEAAARLQVYWSGDPDARRDFLSRALLKPWVELLAAERRPPERKIRQGTCPFCGSLPWMATRRTQEGSDGAQRYLCCSTCGGEWPFLRIRCPSCGEADPEKLPFFHDEARPQARVEACETCKRYVKSIDLSVDARPIPEIDDLLTLSLDLWAQEQGYERIEPGLAGV
jgi:FdhE protein